MDIPTNIILPESLKPNKYIQCFLAIYIFTTLIMNFLYFQNIILIHSRF